MSETWEKILEDIRPKVSRQSFETWFKPARCLSIDDEVCRLELPNKFFKEWIQQHHLKTIEESLSKVTGKSGITVDLILPAEPRKRPSPPKEEDDRQLTLSEAHREATTKAFLNPRYAFDNFVVGPSNQFAHAACAAVAQAASSTYNPLFIYSGVGLGKTHLLHAIGHRTLELNPSAKLCYTSAERFMNELINSIRYDRMIQFRNKYRNMDVLLIDDIQFIAGKERTQEEFFHTFNALYDYHKQIVISSDKMPKEIPDLEERLRSRFEWGLIADIQAPELETKIAILRKKSELNAIDLPDDVSLYLAGTIKSNIRELEGSLVRLGAFASLQGRSIDLDMAREVLGATLSDRAQTVTMDAIKREVAAEFGIKISDLRSKKRTRSVVLPRQMAMYIARKTTDLSLPAIGNQFGGKDHSTVLHSISRIDKMIKDNPNTRAVVESLIDRLT